MTGAMDNFMALCSDEIVNAARLKAYVANGIVPKRFDITCTGCDGLEDILPCVDSDPPVGGYVLPELDPAPWYDAAVPESQNFAGLLVTSVTMSAPYSRTTNKKISAGATLGRLKINERSIVVKGWLIGKTCCAAQYGLRWLTSVLGDSPCAGSGCGGCDLDFLLCCPSIGLGENDCLSDGSAIYVRLSPDDEYARGTDFFRRMHDVGVADGPTVIDCRGSSCGCGCGAMLEVEFTLVAANPYIFTVGGVVIADEPLATCADLDTCEINWVACSPGEVATNCGGTEDCADDPMNPLPPLPPQPGTSIPQGPGCSAALQSARTCVAVAPVKDWSTSTLNIDIFAGDADLRNVLVQIYSNPAGRDCDDPAFDACATCSSVLFSFIPAGGTLRFSGELRTVTVECNGQARPAFSSLSSLDGGAFDWPDLACQDSCVCITTDCNNIGTGATVTITRVDRDL